MAKSDVIEVKNTHKYCVLTTKRSYQLLVWLGECWIRKLNLSKSVTDPIQQEHSAFIHVEMGFDAFRLCVHVLLKAAAHSSQFDCGQVQRAKHTTKHEGRTGLIFKSWRNGQINNLEGITHLNSFFKVIKAKSYYKIICKLCFFLVSFLLLSVQKYY